MSGRFDVMWSVMLCVGWVVVCRFGVCVIECTSACPVACVCQLVWLCDCVCVCSWWGCVSIRLVVCAVVSLRVYVGVCV